MVNAELLPYKAKAVFTVPHNRLQHHLPRCK
jgi:hypothetical protein